MKKYLQYILIATISAVLLSACNKDEDNTVTLTAIVADQLNGGNAKVYINETGGVKYGCWQNGDTVSINGAKKYLSVTSGESLTAAINDVDASNTGYTAGYPYGKTTYGGTPKSISIDIPAVQEYISADDYSGTGASAKQRLLCPMAAYCGSNGSSLKFHNVGAVLKVTISNSYEELLTLHSVEVESEDATVPLSGTCSVTMNDAGEISEATYEGSSKTTLDLSNAGKSLAKNGDPIDLYIPIMPIKESKRTKITIHVYAKGTPDGASSENKYTFHGTSASTVWVDRNQIGAVSIELSSSNKTANDPYFWGQGTDFCPFLIENQEDLEKLRDLTNSGTEGYGSGKYYEQIANIELDGWGNTPIGNASNKAFAAHYDGGGHSVTELSVTETDASYGLFGYAGGGSIKNITVAGSISSSYKADYEGIGGIVGKSTASLTIDCCTSNVALVDKATGNTSYKMGHGGILGCSAGATTISNCWNKGNITEDNAHYIRGMAFGGILGINNHESTSIENCTNTGNILQERTTNTKGNYGKVAGICGQTMQNISISNSTNSGTVRNNSNAESVIVAGGILGAVYEPIYKEGGNNNKTMTSISVSGCTNRGDVSVPNSSAGYCGGIIGAIGSMENNSCTSFVANVTVSNCTNSANVSGIAYTAGIVGLMGTKSTSTLTVSGCKCIMEEGKSFSITTGTSKFAAGIIGKIERLETTLTISDCENQIPVIGGSYSAGILSYVSSGSASNAIEITRCVNSGDITAIDGSTYQNYAGGIAAYINNKPATVTSCYNSGDVKGAQYVGGTLGYFTASNGGTMLFTINGTTNTGEISGTYRIGGIVGDAEAKIIVSLGTKNSGVVSGTNYIGGVIGYANYATTISGTTKNEGVVSGTNYIGGVIGYTKATLTMSGVTNSGGVSGTTYIGGVIGYTNEATTVSGTTKNEGAISGVNNIGGVIGYAYNTTNISSTTNSGSISGTDSIGGIIGATKLATTFSSVENQGSITGGSNVGGIVGKAWSSATISGTQNSGRITGSVENIGGIIGFTNKTVTINGTVSTSGSNKISGSTTARYVGGIIGHHNINNILTINTGVSVINGQSIEGVTDRSGGIIGYSEGQISIKGSVTNNASIAATGENIGGIIGSVYQNKSLSIEGSATNSGTVTGAYNVGGIVGFSNGNINIANCINTNTITATTAVNEGTSASTEFGVAGIIGRSIYTGSVHTINKCYNTGDIISTANDGNYLIGGIVGYSGHTFTIKNCYNSGNLTGNESIIGGIIARSAGNNSSVINCYNQGKISGTLSVGCGGIIGQTNSGTSNSPAKINNCYNSGSFVVNDGVTVYSIAGKNSGTTNYLNLYNCYGASGTTLSNANNEYRCTKFNTTSGGLEDAVTVNTINASGDWSSSYTTLKGALDAWVTKNGSSYSTWGTGPFPTF